MPVTKSPVFWVPSLYFAEGVPYCSVMFLSVIFYKLEGISNGDIAFYTGWLYLPWIIKPLWSPFLKMFASERTFIITCQIIAGALFASIALCMYVGFDFKLSLIIFWLMAFNSATHDIAADGFYISALDDKQSSFWVGIRSTFYKISMLVCQGALVILAGILQKYFIEKKTPSMPAGNIESAWSVIFVILAVCFFVFGLYHLIVLPNCEEKIKSKNKFSIKNYLLPFVTFFKKKGILLSIAFLLLYRLGEAQLSKVAGLFFLDEIKNGGLHLSTEIYGTVYGTVGLVAMSIGGIAGGVAIFRKGLKYWLMPMILILNIPDLFYAFVSFTQTQNLFLISSAVFIEQFGYGFGFAAYSVFMLCLSKGDFSAAHYSVCTAFMAAGMMVPGVVSGYIEEFLGYTGFFIYVTLCCIPTLIIAKYLKIDNIETS